MTNNDLFYVCSLIEYTARQTTNRRGAIVKALGIEGIEKQLHDAPVNHCLTFEQVSAEITEWYHIENGDFDTITHCKYTVPSYLDIGKLYAIIIEMLPELRPQTKTTSELVYDVFSSFLSDEISRFSTDCYYQSPNYLAWSYLEGRLLAS